MMERADTVIAEFAKNSREIVRVAVGAFRGHDLVHIRVWVPNEEGTAIPTKAGLSIRRELLSDLISALERARGVPTTATSAKAA